MKGESLLALMHNLNGQDARLKRLAISNLENNESYTVTTEELPALMRASRNFRKNPNNPDPINASTLYTSVRSFWCS